MGTTSIALVDLSSLADLERCKSKNFQKVVDFEKSVAHAIGGLPLAIEQVALCS